MSRDGTLPPGVEHSSPDAPWNQPDADEYPCVDCGEDVGETMISRPGNYVDEFCAARKCDKCEEPLCRACEDKAAETVGVDYSTCKACTAIVHEDQAVAAQEYDDANRGLLKE